MRVENGLGPPACTMGSGNTVLMRLERTRRGLGPWVDTGTEDVLPDSLVRD